jgi:hypothetical protein
VGDRVEALALRVVREDDRRQRLAVEGAVLREDAVAERLPNLERRGASRQDDLARERVGVDDRKTALPEARGDL